MDNGLIKCINQIQIIHKELIRLMISISLRKNNQSLQKNSIKNAAKETTSHTLLYLNQEYLSIQFKERVVILIHGLK